MHAGIEHVIFGTGPLGRSVAQELVNQGIRPRMVNRSGKPPASFNKDIEVTAADLYQPQAVEQVTRGAKVVYQCVQPEYTEWLEKFPPLIHSIITGMAGSQAKLVYGDNLYMYGDVSGPIHEGLPYTNKGRKPAVRAHIANELMQAHQDGKIRVTIGRGSDFFGPAVHGSSIGDTVFGALVRGKAANVLGNIDLPHTYTFIEDFGKALVVLGDRDEALGQVWHVPNAEAITTRQFVVLAAQAFGVQPKMMAAGPLMMRFLGLFVPEIREMIELEYEVTKPYIVDDSKFKKAFGDHSTPIEQAVGITARWFQENC